MGTYLAQPVTQKNMAFRESSKTKIRFSSCEMQGWRRSMEDACVCQEQLSDGNALFAVFDGHGGPEVSQFVKRKFVQVFTSCQQYKQKKYTDALFYTFSKIDKMIQSDQGQSQLQIIMKQKKQSLQNQEKIQKSLSVKKCNLLEKSITPNQRSTYIQIQPIKVLQLINKMQKRILKKIKINKKVEKISNRAGCTANVVFITNESYIIANCGDSRSILSRNKKSVPLSFDHVPQDCRQFKRIANAGGKLIQGRINGGLNLSRSFGDFAYKGSKNLSQQEQLIISIPDIQIFPRLPSDEFILIGCDGVFERHYYDQQPLVSRINKELKKKRKGPEILAALFENLIAKDTRQIVGCDNMSAILIEFL